MGRVTQAETVASPEEGRAARHALGHASVFVELDSARSVTVS
jgi:hypothetical protein